jgi:NitT/TauT family transport system substrate-binding protein
MPLAASCAPAAKTPLRVGLLPILEVLPFYVAESDGMLTKRGVTVEFVLFPSALERDAALQGGQLDLVLNDLVSAALLNKDSSKPDGDRVRVIRTAFRTNTRLPMVSVVAAPNGGIRAAADLRGKTLAISGNTVIEYVVDRLLEGAGIRPDEVTKTEVTKLPVRVEMVTKGQVAAAALPEPMATLATQQDARRVLDDGATGIGQSVLTARLETVTKRADDLRALLAAFEDGIAAVRANPEKYRPLFVDKAKVPDALRTTLPLPEFPDAVVPSVDDVAAVLKWSVAKGLAPSGLDAAKLIDGSLLPPARGR